MLRHRSIALIAAMAAITLGFTSGCPTVVPPPDGGDPPENRCLGVICDDGDACTTDTCERVTGNCVNTPVRCDFDETCIDGECVGLCDDVDCDDGKFCTGTETCFNGHCLSSGDPCAPGETCDEDADECLVGPAPIPCTSDADCDDRLFCNGTETCGFDGICENGTPPCDTRIACVEIGRRCEAPLVLEMKYFEHAEVAEEQSDSAQIPVILRENGESLILQMPSGQGIDGWVPGTVILVQDEHGTRSYNYVVYATQLADGTVGVIAREATLLSAIDEVRMVEAVGPNAKTLAQRKVIIDDDFDFQHTIDLSDYSIDLGDHATISWVRAGIDFDFTTRARLEINSVTLETIEAGYIWVSGKVSETASSVASLLDDGKIDTEEDIRLLEQRLENDEEFQNQVGDILDAMEDPERIKDASVAIDGTLSGVFQPEFVLSASGGGGDRVFPILPQDILVPLGPIPAQVSLNVSLVLGTDISGEVRLTTGMEFGVRLHAETDWQTRSATAYPTALDGWNGVFLRSIDPVIDADASFSVKAGVQPEIGLTLFQILGFTVNPEIYARLDAEAAGSNDCVQLSYELLGGFDASVRGEALVAWQTNEWSFFNREWSLLGPDVWQSSGCGPIIPVTLTAPDSANSDQSYTVSWTASSNHTRYLLQESTSSNFAGASSIAILANTTSKTFSHEVSADTRYYYRVAADNEATGETSDWSNTDSTLVEQDVLLSCGVSPNPLDFGQVGIGSSSDLTFEIRNTGGGTLDGSVSESCSHFSIVSGGGSYSLSAGQTRNVTVRFAPTSSGQKECLIDTGNADCNSVTVRGVGGNPPAQCNLEWAGGVGPNLGTVQVGAGRLGVLIIENTGGGTLTGSVSESCSHYSIISGGGAFSLGPNQTVGVGVFFQPTSSGTHNCTLSLGSACGSESLTGVGQ